MDMQRGTIYSAILHIGVACLLIFGLPVFMDKEVLDSQPMIVEMVQIADKTNPPPSVEPRQEAPKPVPKPPEEKPQPPQAKPAPEPPPPPEPPKPQVAEVPPEPLPKPPEAKPEPKPQPKKPDPPPPPKETATPPPPKQVANIVPPKKPPPKPKRDDFINSILKDVAPKQQSAEKADKPTPQKTPAPSPSPPSLDQQVSMSEIDAVRQQISRCWNLPAGARDAQDLVVTIRATVAPDGTVTSAVIDDRSRMGDPFFRAAAESAQRAMLNPACQPLKLPPQKYEQWKNLRLNFNPKDMIG